MKNALLASALGAALLAACGDKAPAPGTSPPVATGSSAPPPAPIATPPATPPQQAVAPAASAPPGTLPEVGSTTAGNPAEQGTASGAKR